MWRRTGYRHYDIIRHIKFESVHEKHRYRYKLESFMERRSYQWIKLPYHGDGDDNDGNPVPAPWDIGIRPTNGTLWEPETILHPIPGSAFVRVCEACQGRGWVLCWKCDQEGNYLCFWCDGKGGFYDGEGHWKYCWTCKGIGIVYCAICKGYTRMVCTYCEGYFEVKFFIQLQVEYFVKVHKYYVNEIKTEVPGFKEKKWTGSGSGSGERVFTDEASKLIPLTQFNVPEVNEVSSCALEKHDSYTNNCRIHSQRHFIDVIPIYEVTASWKKTKDESENFVFWVFGKAGQRRVFFPDSDNILPARKGCCHL